MYRLLPLSYFWAQMIFRRYSGPLFLLVCLLLEGCAQVMAPTGGAKDVTAPRLLSVTPEDSLLNTRVTKIVMRFDEFVAVNDVSKQVRVSPILPFPPTVEASRKTVTVKIPDSLLQQNTSYRISFGSAIQDIHEGNPFTGYDFVFSTGSYFDSLSLRGFVIQAATGLKDTGALILLYDASKPDSAVLREKPQYAVKADQGGNFLLNGLPGKAFRIFALHDANDNMIFDGSNEQIAFLDSVVHPSLHPPLLRLNIFTEKDTAVQGQTKDRNSPVNMRMGGAKESANNVFSYIVPVDTSDSKRRTADIDRPLSVNFSKPYDQLNINRVQLSYDSSGVEVEADWKALEDTALPRTLRLAIRWKENTVYTLRLLKGFVKDSAGTDAMPSRYTFRSKRDDDYAKLHVHLPSKYFGRDYLFALLNNNDTVWQRPVLDTIIHFTRLQPGTYTLRIIEDKNHNGIWDAGKLLEHLQPEHVIPYSEQVNLKPGWENMIDFPAEKENSAREDSPGRGDRLRR